MIHDNRFFKKDIVQLSRGNFCSGSGQFDECEPFVWDVLVASSVVMRIDEVLIIGVFVGV